MLKVARDYLRQHIPDMKDASLRLHQLDGPPGSPRYTATAELCHSMAACPHGVSYAVAASGKCPVLNCPLRNTVRLLLTRQGEVVQEMRCGIHWS
jgi:hypothetical protein